MIDFSFPAEVEEIRLKVRNFMDTVVRPAWDATDQSDRSAVVKTIVGLRKQARDEEHLWLPHMPAEWGGMGLGSTAMAAVSAEAAKVSIGPFVLNAQAPDEGNQHTLLHWGTPEQKEKYLRPLCEGTTRSCFAKLLLTVTATNGSSMGTSGSFLEHVVQSLHCSLPVPRKTLIFLKQQTHVSLLICQTQPSELCAIFTPCRVVITTAKL